MKLLEMLIGKSPIDKSDKGQKLADKPSVDIKYLDKSDKTEHGNIEPGESSVPSNSRVSRETY